MMQGQPTALGRGDRTGEVDTIVDRTMRENKARQYIPNKRSLIKGPLICNASTIHTKQNPKEYKHTQEVNEIDKLQDMLSYLKRNPIARCLGKPINRHKTENSKTPIMQRGRRYSQEISADLPTMLADLKKHPIVNYTNWRSYTQTDSQKQNKNNKRGRISPHRESNIRADENLPKSLSTKRAKSAAKTSHGEYVSIKNRLDNMAKRVRNQQTIIQEQNQLCQTEKKNTRERRTRQEKINQQKREDTRSQKYRAERRGLYDWLHPSPNMTAKIMGEKKNKRKRQMKIDEWFEKNRTPSDAQIPTRLPPPRRAVKVNSPEKNKKNKKIKKTNNNNTKMTTDTSFTKLKIQPAHKIRIASLNCPGIAAISETGRQKRKTIRMYCKQNHIDILAVQETHTTSELSKLSSFFAFQTFSSKVSTSMGGVAFIIFNKKIQVIKHMDAQDGNMYSITIQYKSRNITLVNIYAPINKIQQQQFFIQHIGLWSPNSPIMFLGDWNCVEHPQEDTRGRERVTTQTPPSSFQHLHQFYNLIDMTAIKASMIQMTRWNVEHSSGSRLDRIYLSSRMSQWVMAVHNEAIPCTIGTSARHTISDHNIVAVTLSATNTPKGEGYWKMNTQILKSVRLQCKIIDLIRTYLNDKSTMKSQFTKYQILKGNIQSTLKLWSIERAKQIHKKKKKLQKQIEQYTQTIENQEQKHKWRNAAKELLKTRKTLAHIQQEIAQGAWVRSRAKWDFQADKNTKMYFGLERAYSAKKNISSIRQKNGSITTNPEEITEEFKQFYRNLYTRRPIQRDKLDMLLKNVSLKIEKNNADKIKEMVNVNEIRRAIKDTARGSSPGPDGMPIEFYKTFPRMWARVLEGIYYEIVQKGRLPVSMTESFTVLLPKHAEDKQNVANWRPISLLNSDYKILTKVWANRLNPILQKGIGPHQTGFIPGRDIRENIILTQTIIDRMVQQNSPGGILLIDWAKAYDRISHEAIWAVAEKIGLPQHGQSFLKAIYRNPVSWILCNGFMSQVIKLGSGVRQGCPLSPQIFTLVAELYNQNIVKDKNIQGFRVNDRCKIKVISYADDTAIPLITISDAKRCMQILLLYEKATASRVNVIKTCFVACQYRSHINKYMQEKGYRINLPNTHTRYLGVPIGVNIKYNMVWDKLRLDISKELQTWHKICTTIYGRAIILKSKGLGRLWYVSSLLPIDEYAQKIIKAIQKECTNFFWGYKGHKLRYANLMGLPREGGFNLWDLQDKIISLQLKWMTKLENPKVKSLWKINVAQILKNHQTKYQLPLPHSHSTSEIKYKLHSPMVENFLHHWKKVLDRTPFSLRKNYWVASISTQEIPQYIYRVRDTHVWKKDKKHRIKKTQKVPLVDLLWYKDNNTHNTPMLVREYAHALVPVKVRIQNGIVLEVIAIFPPVRFMRLSTNKNIQLISAMSNKDYYMAMRSIVPRDKKKIYKWPNINQEVLEQAFTNNHQGKERANVRQTRWLVLTHSLPVRSRLHKMNTKMTVRCPTCNYNETIRHCLYTCTINAPIWDWFRKIWKMITHERLPNMHSNYWISNNIQSSYSTQLREICNIITHSIWINRNKIIFHNKEVLSIHAMIFNIATQWNIHIRAQLHTEKIKHEQAIYYGRVFTPEKGWQPIWERIQAIQLSTKVWSLLQATIGDTHTTTLLYNEFSQYTEKSDANTNQIGSTTFDYRPKIRNSRITELSRNSTNSVQYAFSHTKKNQQNKNITNTYRSNPQLTL